MKTILKFVVLMSFFFIISCRKDTDKLTFDVSMNITSLICYPNDSISMTFYVNSSNGKAPYNYNWINPDTFAGEGPFTINININILLDLEVIDANNTKMRFRYEIKKDTIDSLKFDYRNAYTGLYDCTVNYCDAHQNPAVYSTYQDTIDIFKHNDFKMLQISNIQEVDFNFRKLTFGGYHLSGKFKNDSIKFYYFLTPAAIYNYTYKGKKIN